MVDLKIYGGHNFATSKTNNCNTNYAQYLKTMKFGQLIDYNTKKIFLEKSYLVVKLLPDTFPKKSKLSVSLDQQSEVL